MAQPPFRSIRQKLFNEGKLLRYLGYAVGEIALIIISMLTALQLNNWNEDRKAQVEFEFYIVQLMEDVRTAIDDIEEVEAFNQDRSSKIAGAIQYLQLPETGPETFAVFEDGLHYLGQCHEAHVNIGLLGRLMNGGMSSAGTASWH